MENWMSIPDRRDGLRDSTVCRYVGVTQILEVQYARFKKNKGRKLALPSLQLAFEFIYRTS